MVGVKKIGIEIGNLRYKERNLKKRFPLFSPLLSSDEL